GNDLYLARESNPKGFFENALINGINESILEKYDFVNRNKEFPLFDKKHSPFQPTYGQRWLTYIQQGVTIKNFDKEVKEKIIRVISLENFAFKDPRFNYTLKVWNKYLNEEVIFLCIIRHPEIVAESVLKDCQTADYLLDFYISKELVYQLWFNSYSHLLNNLKSIDQGRIVFIHYEQLLSGDILQLLSVKLEARLTSNLISPDLNRSRTKDKSPKHVRELYNHLCKLANFRQKVWWNFF
ncbi:MAG: hypothetical protein HQ541_20690, partial [Mariniphaga sp.]|nr:hypothetical protein [Mariniphaga sp.]